MFCCVSVAKRTSHVTPVCAVAVQHHLDVCVHSQVRANASLCVAAVSTAVTEPEGQEAVGPQDAR
jgi:hypothetical protein